MKIRAPFLIYYFMKLRLYILNSIVLFFISNQYVIANTVNEEKKDSIIQFFFTSDVHFGLVKNKFRGKFNVPAIEVNKAMVAFMNQVQYSYLPNDNGVEASQQLNGIDALVITGDIANRMENGVQTATQSWKEFTNVFVDSLQLKKSNHKKTELFVVPGNHDMSNAIGFHRKMEPKKDAASMIGIYNLMFPKTSVEKFDSTLTRVHFSKDIKGVHFIFLSLYPDSAERVWMEADL